MITTRTATCLAFLFLSASAWADGTNFVVTLDAKWRAANATEIRSYVDTELAAKTSPEALFARGLVAAYLETWGRGATNYMAQAATAVDADPDYTAAQKESVKRVINEAKGHFTALTEEAAEPADSQPKWDTATHSVIFTELNELPFLHVLQKIVVP